MDITFEGISPSSLLPIQHTFVPCSCSGAGDRVLPVSDRFFTPGFLKQLVLRQFEHSNNQKAIFYRRSQTYHISRRFRQNHHCNTRILKATVRTVISESSSYIPQGTGRDGAVYHPLPGIENLYPPTDFSCNYELEGPEQTLRIWKNASGVACRRNIRRGFSITIPGVSVNPWLRVYSPPTILGFWLDYVGEGVCIVPSGNAMQGLQLMSFSHEFSKPATWQWHYNFNVSHQNLSYMWVL